MKRGILPYRYKLHYYTATSRDEGGNTGCFVSRKKNDVNAAGSEVTAGVTIYDLAEDLGVSASTVSRALSGSPKVGEKTRQRVLEAARAANYMVNTAARTLRQGRARTIEVVFPLAAVGRRQISEPFYVDMLAVIAEELTRRNYDLLLFNTVPWMRDNASQSNRVDGMIMIGGQGHEHDAINKFASSYQNLVVWGAKVKGQQYLTVGSDNITGGRIAAEHIISLGHKKIAYFGDPMEPEMEQRREGFFQVMAEAGMKVDPSLLFRVPFDARGAKIAAQAAVASGRHFDAAICGSDVIALNVMDVLKTAGRRVPDDVSVIGYDDISLAYSYGQKLTTICQHIPVGGSLLVDLLFSVINGEDIAPVTIPPTLKIRESCGVHRRRN